MTSLPRLPVHAGGFAASARPARKGTLPPRPAVNPFFRTKVPFPSNAFPLPRVTIRSEHPFAPVAGAVALTPWASCFSREDRLPRLGPGLLRLGLFHHITWLWSTPAPSALPPLPRGPPHHTPAPVPPPGSGSFLRVEPSSLASKSRPPPSRAPGSQR